MKPLSETHPSYVRATTYIPLNNDKPTMEEVYESRDKLKEDAVQKHTVDKQVLRQKIKDHLVCGHEQGLSGAVHSVNCRKCALIRSLDLEEKK